MSGSRLSKISKNSKNSAKNRINVNFPKGRLQTLKINTDDPMKIADLRAHIKKMEKRASKPFRNSQHRVSVLTPRGDIIEQDQTEDYQNDLPSVKGKLP